MNDYWLERFAAVRDGGMLGNADAEALIDYVGDLELAARFAISDPAPRRYIDLNRVLESGPKIPED